MIGGTLNIKHVRTHWDDILRLASSIKHGTVTASLMLRKLGSYPRQNGLAIALRAGAHRTDAIYPRLAPKR
jgi:TnpA family transposase